MAVAYWEIVLTDRYLVQAIYLYSSTGVQYKQFTCTHRQVYSTSNLPVLTDRYFVKAIYCTCIHRQVYSTSNLPVLIDRYEYKQFTCTHRQYFRQVFSTSSLPVTQRQVFSTSNLPVLTYRYVLLQAIYLFSPKGDRCLVLAIYLYLSRGIQYKQFTYIVQAIYLY